jgi:hypothetical protein
MDATQTPREKMTAFVNAQPLRTLATSLLMLDAKPKLDEAERLTRAVIIDSICERCPAAEAAFDAWAESDDTDPHAAARAMAVAAMAA